MENNNNANLIITDREGNMYGSKAETILPVGSRVFKIRCSQISKIMGRMGLTETQEATLEKLATKKTPRTALQEIELDRLKQKQENPELPQTAKSYLHAWYAGDEEQIVSKEINKGNAMELDAIDFMCEVLQLGVVERNLERKADDYIEGMCDVDVPQLNSIVDVKVPWNNTTFQSNCEVINDDYQDQGIGYCHLWGREKFILFYALMDTPEDVNYGKEVIFSDRPNEQRWIAYEVNANPERIAEVIERVKLCRIYLESYDKMVRSRLGRINPIISKEC